MYVDRPSTGTRDRPTRLDGVTVSTATTGGARSTVLDREVGPS